MSTLRTRRSSQMMSGTAERRVKTIIDGKTMAEKDTNGPYRTFMFAPGNHARKVEKVFDVGADAVILDLEDAVATNEKIATRDLVVAALKLPRGPLGYVRVNAYDTEFCYGDAVAIVGPWIDGIVLPMVESADQLRSFDWLLRNLERDRGLPEGVIDLIPIIETGKGVAALPEIASCGTRVRRMAFGAGDYTLDMGMTWSLDEWELDQARARMVLESRVAGLEAPIDTVWVHIKDIENLERSAQRVKAMGFQGKMCIYPPQVEPVNATFTPTDEEVARAKRIVAAFDAAEKEGSASIQLDGYFIDYPIVYKAQQTLAVMETIRSQR
jgi:citrate lyase subunit beta / citryl-CoA lyase